MDAPAVRGGTDASKSFDTVSHELRTPLTSVLGYLELVLDDAELRDDHRSHLQVAHRCGERLRRAIEEHVTPASFGGGGASGGVRRA